MAAAWPTVDDLRVALGIAPGTLPGLDGVLTEATETARDQVLIDTGQDADLYPVPGALWFAARYLAIQAVRSVDAPFGIAGMVDIGALYVAKENPIYARLLRGYRVSFGVA